VLVKFKWLSGILVLAGTVWGIGQAPDTSAAPHSSIALGKAGVPCIEDRFGHSCGGALSVENDEFVISPDGLSAYRAIPYFGANERSVFWIYDRDPATGSLVQKQGTAGCISDGRRKGCVRGRALSFGYNIVVSPDGRNVYASTQNSIAIFDRDPSTGDLTQPAGASGCITSNQKENPSCALGRGLFSGPIAISPDGLNVYDSGRGLAIFDRDPTTGALTQKPGLEGLVPVKNGGDVLVSPDGANVYVSTYEPERLITFDRAPTTGSLTRVPAPAGCISELGKGGCRRGREFAIGSLTISPDGRNVYGLGWVASKVGALVILDRLPDGTLMQKPGRAGCIGSESGKNCANPFSLTFLGAENDLSISADGTRVYALEYIGIFEEGVVFTRHPSGQLTEAPEGDR
jgi:hypothetical protein